MSNGNNQNAEFAIIYLIDNPVCTNSNAPGGTSGQFTATFRTRIVSESSYGGDNAGPILVVDFFQLFLGGSQNRNRILQPSNPSSISRTACSKGIRS